MAHLGVQAVVVALVCLLGEFRRCKSLYMILLVEMCSLKDSNRVRKIMTDFSVQCCLQCVHYTWSCVSSSFRVRVCKPSQDHQVINLFNLAT